jgi:ubiquinol-cytochrome c reductase cytochrome c1 subunit
MKMLKTLAIAGSVLAALAGGAMAAEGQKDAKDIAYSFEGPFGHFDRAQLQRGYKVYKDTCSACHSLRLMAFRNLADHGGPEFSEEQVKALAASFPVTEPSANGGEPVERPGVPSDRFPLPPAAGGDAVPPDLSLITKSRAGWYGTFNQLVNGIGGPEYVYSVLTGYEAVPEELKAEQPAGKDYNPYFASGHWIGMPAPLTDDATPFDDGTPATIDQKAKDVAAFLAWTAEPKMEERKQTGFMVMVYLAILSVLLYLGKKKLWAKEH